MKAGGKIQEQEENGMGQELRKTGVPRSRLPHTVAQAVHCTTLREAVCTDYSEIV